MVFPSSLRAQRGNPDFGAAAGLPLRFGEAEVYPERLQACPELCQRGSQRATRNDERLRAFAPSREPKLFLFSREAAKAQRIEEEVR